MSDLRKCIYTSLIRNVTAVNGALMAVSSDDFLDVGMFDETFELVGWDVDLCVRSAMKGLSSVYTPYASARMAKDPLCIEDADEANRNRCCDVFRKIKKNGDPYFSPNYDRRFTYPQLLIKPIDNP